MPSGPPYFVLLGDLVGSRRVRDRHALGARIDAALAEIAGAWPDAGWVAGPVLTRGIDELAAVLTRPRRAFDAAVQLNLAIWPDRFRFALASGAIDIGLEAGIVAAMDGTAFHRAADALARARRDRLPLTLALPDCPEPGPGIVEAAAGLHQAAMVRWTSREAATVSACRAAGSQASAAASLGVSQQAVSDALRRAAAADLAGAEDSIRQWLDP
ncbi:MAG: SatD family protein [Planctomycetota bacterium]|jgi:hypothetical protein